MVCNGEIALKADLREDEITNFLALSGWDAAQRLALAGDASTRRYQRLSGPKGAAILMDAPFGAETSPCPVNASFEERTALGYNALARLAGADVRAFSALSHELVQRGFSAPRVLAADHAQGLLLLEDLGDALFSTIPVEKEKLYGAATDTLAALCRSSFGSNMPFGNNDWTVLDYDPCALLTETDMLLDWYAPFRGTAPDEAARQEAHELWADAFTALETLPRVLTLRDVHAENLIWLPKRDGVARTGLLDFQDAVFGSPAYDLVSLLQDSRRILPSGLEDAMLTRFLEASKIRDREAFAHSYAILGAQRSAKVLGIFVRLAQRDSKPRYLDFLSITARNMARNLEHPALAELKGWMQCHVPMVFEESS